MDMYIFFIKGIIFLVQQLILSHNLNDNHSILVKLIYKINSIQSHVKHFFLPNTMNL